MTKKEILDNLIAAKKAHIAWVDKASLLIHGLEGISQNQLPLKSVDCKFGQWFFHVGQVLFCIMSEALVKSIEDKHEELHKSYLKIFKLYFNEEENNYILEKRKEFPASVLNEAEDELRKLENISEELIVLLDRVASNFDMLDDEDLVDVCKKFIAKKR